MGDFLVDLDFAPSISEKRYLVGATSAALSRYYFRKSGNNNSEKIRLRSVLPVNLRPTPSLQTDVNMIESGKSDDVAWGNQLGYIILPLHLAMHDDPLAYIRKAKKTLDRKKSSLEVVFTCKMSELFLKMVGVKAGAFIFRRMFANTTISFTSMINTQLSSLRLVFMEFHKL
ncbi:hypothetical protein ACQ4PT_036529 [Festuca glaucescens]